MKTYDDESSEEKQERFKCYIGFGVNSWSCYWDCAFWDGDKCTKFE